MVTQFGMSDVIGPIAIGDREQEIFLGREVMQRREVSERTAEIVDQEVKRILGEAFGRARDILTTHRDDLDRLAAALLEHETLDGDEVNLVVAGKALPPAAAPATPTPPAAAPPGTPRGKATPRPGVLGSPPPEPAGA
jgi:cell division protease FtsH